MKVGGIAARVRPTWLVFGLLWCLYALTGGGQGYSVDGTFSYEVARSLATDPALEFVQRNRGTLARWGPVVPALGVPFAWAGDRLGRLVPRRDTVPLDGRLVRLYDWPPIGQGAPETLRLPIDPPSPVGSLRLVSFLSLSTGLAQGTPVAEVMAVGAGGGEAEGAVLGRAVIRAGEESAEWAMDVPGAERPRHRRASPAGHWPGYPQANLYAARVALAPPPSPGAGDASHSLLVRYLASEGRLHLRVAIAEPPLGAAPLREGGASRSRPLAPEVAGVELRGPEMWSDGAQAAFFARFGYSFLNGLLVALTGALLVPLGRLLGYGVRPAVAVALVFGLATLAWPHAKHDFAEPAAGLFLCGAAVLALAARERRGWLALVPLAAAGASVALAAGAKYAAAWAIPLLGVQVLLLWGRRAPLPLAVTLAPALLAAALTLALSGRVPALWSGWRQGVASGWLDFAVADGLYGLLLSPGKSLFLYAPPLLLAVAGLPGLVRRHRARAFFVVALPLVYLLVYGSKGVWHGGGWGPRYLVPAVPFVALWGLPVAEALLGAHPARAALPRRLWPSLRAGALALVAAGVIVQGFGVAKHPNRYAVMFRDHILPGLPDYGVAYGGVPALAYWRHFGGPEAGRQLSRPPLLPSQTVSPDGRSATGAPAPSLPSAALEGDAPRGLGYAFAESGPLTLRVEATREVSVAATVYACDWDHRQRRQRLTLSDAGGQRVHAMAADFSGCEFLTWPVRFAPGQPLELRVDSLAGDVPVLSGVFFDPPRPLPASGPARDAQTSGAWVGRYGADGYVLLGWRRGGVDVGRLPPYVAAYGGGERVWLDTGEAELADTAPLYAPAFSPLLAHAWLLGADVVGALAPGNGPLMQRALASPPWRYLAGLELHAPHPEYGLGLDSWQGLLRDGYRSHPGVMAGVWAATLALAAGALLAGVGLARSLVREAPLAPRLAPRPPPAAESVTRRPALAAGPAPRPARPAVEPPAEQRV